MLKTSDRIFVNLQGQKPWDLESARQRGDWSVFSTWIAKGREAIRNEVINSGLRGRGGAGFSTGKKWSFMPEPSDKPHYLVVNGDEGEPGTAKDRNILRFEPHKLLEGIVLASFAIHARVCYIYVRGEFHQPIKHIKAAIDQAYAAHLIGPKALWPVDVFVHSGAGAYICGEETALLESLEGKRGLPRLKPPFPAQRGLYGCPTTINNVESLAVVPSILKNGALWFQNLGRAPHSAGSKIFTLSGHVHRPCNVEESLGIPLKNLIEHHGQGVQGGWNNLLAVIPGGSSVPLLPASVCQDVTMDYEALEAQGSHLGTGAVIVMNRQTPLIDIMARLAKFYMHESCGQCSPCREGTGWLWRLMETLRQGSGNSQTLDMLEKVTHSIDQRTICALGSAAAWPIQGFLRHFRPELEHYIKNGSFL